MAFFKFRWPGRKPGEDQAASTAQPESVEALRRRARHRLIGAAVLVLTGVIGFPLLFDTQPRPIAVDIPIEIPDKNKAKPLVIPAAPAPAPAKAAPDPAPAPGGIPASSRVSDAASLDAREEVVTAPKSEEKQAPAPVAPASSATTKEAKSEPKPEAKPATKADHGAKARALLEGTAAEATAEDGRFVVQVGAFSDAAKARETRLKVEKAGLKTYTQVVETKDGKRIRVRVGPFASKADADKAAHKIKGLDLPAAILTL